MESQGDGEREGGSSETKWNSLSTSIPGEEDQDIMSLLFGSTPFPDGSETMDFTSFLWNDQDEENNFNDWSQTSTDSHLPPPHNAHNAHNAHNSHNSHNAHNAHNAIESYYLNDPSAGEAVNDGGPVEMNFFVAEDKTTTGQVLLPQRKPTPKRLHEIDKNTSNTKKKKKLRMDGQVTETNSKRKKSDSRVCKSLSGLSNEDDSSMVVDNDERSSKWKNKVGPVSAVGDPQSIYAKKRRERINERLKILQNLVPNGTKVDISTMLEEAVEYVKFLKLQIKVLSSDDMWMYAPIAYNGMDSGLDLKRSPPQQKSK